MDKGNAVELITTIATLLNKDKQFDKIVLTRESEQEGTVRMAMYRGKGKKALKKTFIIHLVSQAKMAIIGVKSRVPRIKGKAIPSWSGQRATQPSHVIEAADLNLVLVALGIDDVRVIPHDGSYVVGKVIKPKDTKK